MSDVVCGDGYGSPGSRARYVLQVAEGGETAGFVVPTRREGTVIYRGLGPADYACGGCGRVLAAGVRPGMFRSLVFSCECGALNRVA
ncbi:MAG: hypothetical protein ACJ79R_17170 [Anaeromyxobacteraceae bacterium]